MRIAINTRFLLNGKMEGFGWYTYEIVKRIVEQHPEHEFYFFFDRPFDKKFIFGDNVKALTLSPPARHPILFYLWFDLAVPRALKKHKIDLFFSPDGYLSLKTKVPQIATIHDINFEHFPKDIPFAARHYLRYFFPKFAKKAVKIITVSDYSKQDIAKTYGVDSSKIHAIWNGASNVFKPMSEDDIARKRKEISEGKPYFLFVGALHPRKNLIRLMNAYNLYAQKEGGSAYHLVIVGENLWKNKGFSVHPDDAVKDKIHFTGRLELEELAKVTGASGALAYVPYFEGFGIPLVEAMKCGIPIVAGNLTSLPEVAGDTAIYCDPFDEKSIEVALTEMATNEELRNTLANKSLERSKVFSWDIAAEKIWNVLISQAK
jgi:glycosyltransferase involved in cell wall biosynthesis|tara:strand:- start:3046 stop:4170 length:1125 start_codon:yes stop_codon:yes gene_type:complete